MINVGAIVTNNAALGSLHPEPWVLPVTQDEFRAQYAGWSPYLHHVIDVRLHHVSGSRTVARWSSDWSASVRRRTSNGASRRKRSQRAPYSLSASHDRAGRSS